jgi:hypothetical protein
MASQAARRRIRLAETHDFGDSCSNRIGQIDEGVRVFVTHYPGAVLILQNRSLASFLYAAVATGRTARTRPGVLRRPAGIRCQQAAGHKSQEQVVFHFEGLQLA